MRWLTLGLLVAGCSFINDPKRPPGDAGMDVPRDVMGDADAPDVTPDAPDAGFEHCGNRLDDDGDGQIDCADPECEAKGCDATQDPANCLCVEGFAVEKNCDDNVDNDGNGLADCADYDCVSAVDCCGAAVIAPASWPDSDSTWPTTSEDLEAEWETTSSTGQLPVRVDGKLNEFPGDDPFALVHFTCLNLALGANFEARFTPQGGVPVDRGCSGMGSVCDSFASIVFSPVRDALPGRRLLDDLAVVFYPNGRVDVTQAGDPLPMATANVEVGIEQAVSITLSPDIDERGVPVLRADVSVGPAGGTVALQWSGEPIELDQLIDDGACSDLPGLYLAFQGHGDGVVVGNLVTAEPRACVNPSQFAGGLATLTADGAGSSASLDFHPPPAEAVEGSGIAWADEVINSPTLLSVSSNWHVMVEASNDQPELVAAAPIGYAIGHAVGGPGWPSDLWNRNRSTPRLGAQPPSCLDMTCDLGDPPAESFRDPYLFSLSGTLYVAFTEEIFDAAAPTETFQIHIGAANGETPIALPPVALLTPVTAGCQSVRDPIVVPRPGGSINDFWLMYTCERAGRGESIDAVPLHAAGGWTIPAGAVPLTLLRSEDMAAFGRGGIRSPEVVLDGETFRMWFLGRSQVGTTAVGLAIGGPKSEFPLGQRETTPDIPVLEPYRANPVLTQSDRSLRDCVGCTIEGLAVTRVDAGTIRFLVARRVPLTMGRRYELVPLDQPIRE